MCIQQTGKMLPRRDEKEMLHESASIFFDHKIKGPKDPKKQEERDAGRFATEQLLTGISDSKMLQKRSLGIAIATLTLTALDLRAKRLELGAHPRSVERLHTNLRNYISEEDAELAHAVAISVFLAHVSIFGVEHAIDHNAEFGPLLDAGHSRNEGLRCRRQRA